MKLLLSVFVLVMSTSAFADYFGCELKVNGVRAENEAPYRGREVSVTVGDYTCEAVIDSDITVTAKITSALTGSWAQAAGRASAALNYMPYNPTTDSIDTVLCKCGLR